MSPELETLVAKVTRALRAPRFRHASERDLQAGIAEVLAAHGIPHERERSLSPQDRIDFFLTGGLGIEVKVRGQAGAVEEQLRRYAEHAEVLALMLVTTQQRIVLSARALAGKPLHVVYLTRSSFG